MNLIIVLTLSSIQPSDKPTSHLTCSESIHYLPRSLCTVIGLSGVNLAEDKRFERLGLLHPTL